MTSDHNNTDLVSLSAVEAVTRHSKPVVEAAGGPRSLPGGCVELLKTSLSCLSESFPQSCKDTDPELSHAPCRDGELGEDCDMGVRTRSVIHKSFCGTKGKFVPWKWVEKHGFYIKFSKLKKKLFS